VTAPQRGAITVYKGLKPSLTVCNNVCIAEEPTVEASVAEGPAPVVTSPDVSVSGPAPQAMSAQ
jgi:hypothetical protein